MEWADRVGRRVKLRDLNILLAVAQCGSMAKAAEQLAISHPVISKAISELEHTLGVRLLDRSARGAEATVYGQALLKCGVAIFDEMRQGLQQIEFLSKASSGELRVGCPEQFARQCPAARLYVVHADTASAHFQELRERRVDLLIGTMPSPFLEDDLTAETLLNERLVVISGKQSPWARRRHVKLDDLILEPWVLAPADTIPGKIVAGIFAGRGLSVPRANLVGLSLHLTLALVATGRFIALMSGSVVQFNAKRFALKILPVKLPPQGPAIGVITLKNRTIGPLAKRFIECARRVASPLAKHS
jgi:DNA-binding transcriptional LysR family regulator